MSFAQEKRLLLCWLALLAPLPLPLNEPRPEGVIGWPFLLAYLLAVTICLRRVVRGRESWLGPLWLNLLGLAYIPFLVFDVMALRDGNLVRPMMHLVLFTLVAKLFSLQRERDKWHVVVGTFFVFISAMATSASAGIIFYLVAFLSLSVLVLARFARLHLLSVEQGARATGATFAVSSVRGSRSTVLALVAATLLLAVPLFALLPRLNDPFLKGGAGGRSLGFSTGFSDRADLDVTGRVRGNRQVALRLEVDGSPPRELRFRGGVFERFDKNSWRRGRRALPIQTARDGRYRLADGAEVSKARVFLEPIGVRSLLVPVQTLAVKFDGPVRSLTRSRGGALRLGGPPATTLSYEVDLAPVPVSLAQTPSNDRDGTLGSENISAEIANLAASVAGEGSALERARRIERHLINNYEYTLDFVGRPGGQPIDDFLFKYQSGHCEYFASAMVLMLRSVGTHARFVTGFLGGEYNPLGYFIVRQNNAHAWVEAYIPDQGWTIFDPTPPSGRPAVEPRSLLTVVRQAYDFVVFGWDRYVVSYGLADQAELLGRLRRLLASWLDSEQEMPEPTHPPASISPGDGATGPTGIGWSSKSPWLLLLLPLTVLGWLWWRRPAPSATTAYLSLRRLAAARGVTVTEATPPVLLQTRLARRFPQAEEPAARVVTLYLRESYGGESLSEEECSDAERQLERARESLRRAS